MGSSHPSCYLTFYGVFDKEHKGAQFNSTPDRASGRCGLIQGTGSDLCSNKALLKEIETLIKIATFPKLFY